MLVTKARISKIKSEVDLANRKRSLFRRINIDPVKLSKLEPKYLKELQMNMHYLIPLICKDYAGGWNFYTDFTNNRRDRNKADYEINPTFSYPSTKSILDVAGRQINEVHQGTILT